MRKDLKRAVYAIMRWQGNNTHHPLTCGNDSSHLELIPVIETTGPNSPVLSRARTDRVVLLCVECDYRQEHIPPVCLMPEDE